jgi:ubiquinone/menaquinone biosynthesis C-methylase UbiE
MTTTFDDCAQRYSDEVQSSIAFSGLRQDFFLEAKVDVLARVLRAHFGAGKPATMLDVGCGIGLLHSRLAALCETLVAADTSAASIAQARRSNPGVAYSVIDGSLPYRDATFDVVLAVCVVHHVPPGDWDAFVGEMHRVTRKGGLICVIEHNPLNPLTRLAVSRCSFDADAVLLRAGRTRALLERAGGSAIRTEFFLTLPSRRPFAVSVERWLRRLPFGAQYFVSAEA